MRIATFNILHGRSLDDGRVDVDRLAAAVKTPGRRRARPAGGGPRPAAFAAAPTSPRWPPRRWAPSTPSSWPRCPGRPGGTWMAATGEEQPGSASYGVSLLSRYPVVSWRVVRLPPLRVSVPLWSPRHPPPVPGPRRAAGGGGRRPGRAVRPVHRLQHPPVVHPGVERARSCAGWCARSTGTREPLALIGDLNMQQRQAAKVSGLRSDRVGRHLPGGRARAGSSTTSSCAAACGRPGRRRRCGCRCRTTARSSSPAVRPDLLPDDSRTAPRWATMRCMASNGAARIFSLVATDRAGRVLGDRRA